MWIGIDLGWMALVLLASVRVGALFALTPLFGPMALPARVRAALALLLAVALVWTVRPDAAAALSATRSLGALAFAALSEAALGAAMAFGLFSAFAALHFAGKLLDIQIGLSLGTVFDPVTRAQSPLLGTLLGLLGAMLFFALDGHLLLLRGLAHAFTVVPPGHAPFSWHPRDFADQFGVSFVFGLVLAAPLVFALLLIDVGLGIASRTMPQLNIFTVGIPVKIVMALLLLVATLPAMAPTMARVFATAFAFWRQLLGS